MIDRSELGMFRKAVLIGGCAIVGACGPGVQAEDATDCPSLRRFDFASPEAAAARDFERGDRGFRGLHGLTVETPGVSSTDLPVTMIEGTSDAPESDRCERLNERARDYARLYNQAMLGALERHRREQK